MSRITINFDEQSVEVIYHGRYNSSEIAYVDKHTSMEDVAQGFYELCAALNVEAELKDIE